VPVILPAMQDRLSIITKRVEESELDKAEIARRLGIDRGTLYNWLADPELSKDKLAMLGLVIGHDFGIDFPEMKGHHFYFKDQLHIVGEPLPVYGRTAKEDMDAMKNELRAMRKEVSDVHRKMDIMQETLMKLLKNNNF
jgi:hypothetical protein